MGEHQIRESIAVNADPQRVWELVSDPANYPRWSPEATKTRRLTGAGPWVVGDRFVGSNKTWVPWSTRCTVVQADNMEFAFDVGAGPFPIARWGYKVIPTENGCIVEESFTDRRAGVSKTVVAPLSALIGRGWDADAHNRSGMRSTLEALRVEVESGIRD